MSFIAKLLVCFFCFQARIGFSAAKCFNLIEFGHAGWVEIQNGESATFLQAGQDRAFFKV